MNSPHRWGWLTSRRFIRLATALIVPLALIVILYNATNVDRVPPSVSSITVSSLAPNSSLAFTGSVINVKFSEDVVQETATAAFKIAPDVKGTFHWNGDQLMIFTPKDKLPLQTQFKVTIGPGVKDKAGNASAGSTDFAFKTVAAPSVTAVSPKPNAENVPIESSIQITFDRFMSVDSVVPAITIEPATDFDASWAGQVLTLKPKKNLVASTLYTVIVGNRAKDTDGTPLASYSTTFKTVGLGLTTLARVPTNGVAGVNIRTPIAVIFDGAIDPASINPSPFQVTPPVSGDVHAVALPDDSKPQAATSTAPATALVFTPSQPLAPHTTYTVTLRAGVKKTDGQAAQGATWTFTTGDASTTTQNQIVFLSDRAGVANIWLMNPDGTNPRQLTTELVPVTGFDVATDGSKVVYTAGGVVKRLTVASHDVATMTANGRFEYAPSFTPDGNSVLLGRRDQAGNDQGYWLVSLNGGEQHVLDTGAPGLGSVSLKGDGLTEDPGRPSWAARVAYSKDGTTALLVRGDNGLELLNLTNPSGSKRLDFTGQGLPVYLKSDDAFFVVAARGLAGTAADWRIDRQGNATMIGAAVGELAGSVDGNTGRIAFLAAGSDGVAHLGIVSSTPGSTPRMLTQDQNWAERSAAFSPDGGTVVFIRVPSDMPTTSAGIWTIKTDGSGLQELATDGVYPIWMP